MKGSLTLFFLFVSFCVQGQEQSPIKTEVLQVSTTTWDGNMFEAYPDGQPEITISRITLEPGARLPMHYHPNPLGGVILSGELTVYKEDGASNTFLEGDPILEIVNTKHFGENTGDVVTVLIAFYVGIEGVPLTILDE